MRIGPKEVKEIKKALVDLRRMRMYYDESYYRASVLNDGCKAIAKINKICCGKRRGIAKIVKKKKKKK